MRPMGDVAQALLDAARQRVLVAGQGATLAELTATAQVGRDAARQTIANLSRRHVLVPVGHAPVARRGRHAQVYAPAELVGLLAAGRG